MNVNGFEYIGFEDTGGQVESVKCRYSSLSIKYNSIVFKPNRTDREISGTVTIRHYTLYTDKPKQERTLVVTYKQKRIGPALPPGKRTDRRRPHYVFYQSERRISAGHHTEYIVTCGCRRQYYLSMGIQGWEQHPMEYAGRSDRRRTRGYQFPAVDQILPKSGYDSGRRSGLLQRLLLI